MFFSKIAHWAALRDCVSTESQLSGQEVLQAIARVVECADNKFLNKRSRSILRSQREAASLAFPNCLLIV